MAVVTITSHDPIEMYWRMVFYGAAYPIEGVEVVSKDEETGLFILRLDLV